MILPRTGGVLDINISESTFNLGYKMEQLAAAMDSNSNAKHGCYLSSKMWNIVGLVGLNNSKTTDAPHSMGICNPDLQLQS